MANRPYVGLDTAIEARALEALLEIAGAVGEALDPVRIAQLAVKGAAPLLQADAAYVWMWDDQAEVLRIIARHDPGATASAKQDSRVGESIVGQVFVQRQPVVVDDYQSWEFARRTMASSGAKSAMGVPLLINDRPIGTLVVHNYQQRPFDGRQVELLSLFAAQVAPALEMARLYVEADRRRAEAEAISISLAEGVCATNASGIITFANPAAQKLLGLEEHELLGHDLHRVVHRHLSDSVPCFLDEVLHQGAAAHVEDDDFYRANGSTLSVALSASAIIEGEAVTGLVLAFRDITARKQLEVQLQRFNTELEQRVLERTEELEAANHELEAFSYSVSHDLRSPLRSMDGFCQVLLEEYGDRLDEAGRGYLHRVRAGSQRMAQLIDDLLELSRVTRVEMRRQPVNLTEIAWSAIEDLRLSGPERAVTFAVAEGLELHGDPQLMRIVLVNLLANAWKFSSKHATAHIEFGAKEINGQRTFFVRDDGAGFDMNYAHKLFGPFQRLHGMSEFEGTGIGLATVQRAIRRHGGNVWAEGVPEQGACVYFSM